MEQDKNVFLDDEVSQEILRIIEEAKEYVILITPYLDLWVHLLNHIVMAIRKNVRIKLVLRADQNQIPVQDINMLEQYGVKVLYQTRLHAKIYLNEKTVFISSMNLHELSASNNFEVGIVVRDPKDDKVIRSYVDYIFSLPY